MKILAYRNNADEVVNGKREIRNQFDRECFLLAPIRSKEAFHNNNVAIFELVDTYACCDSKI